MLRNRNVNNVLPLAARLGSTSKRASWRGSEYFLLLLLLFYNRYVIYIIKMFVLLYFQPPGLNFDPEALHLPGAQGIPGAEQCSVM